MSSVGTAPPLGSQWGSGLSRTEHEVFSTARGRSSEPAWPWHSPIFARAARTVVAGLGETGGSGQCRDPAAALCSWALSP